VINSKDVTVFGFFRLFAFFSFELLLVGVRLAVVNVGTVPVFAERNFVDQEIIGVAVVTGLIFQGGGLLPMFWQCHLSVPGLSRRRRWPDQQLPVNRHLSAGRCVLFCLVVVRPVVAIVVSSITTVIVVGLVFARWRRLQFVVDWIVPVVAAPDSGPELKQVAGRVGQVFHRPAGVLNVVNSLIVFCVKASIYQDNVAGHYRDEDDPGDAKQKTRRHEIDQRCHLMVGQVDFRPC